MTYRGNILIHGKCLKIGTDPSWLKFSIRYQANSDPQVGFMNIILNVDAIVTYLYRKNAVMESKETN